MRANRLTESGPLHGLQRRQSGPLRGLAGARREDLPANTIEFWDAHDLDATHEKQDEVQVWGSSILTDSGVSDGIVAKSSGMGGYYMPGALGGGPAVRIVPDGEFSTRERNWQKNGKVNFFYLLRHPKRFTPVKISRGTRGTYISVEGETLRERTSSMWGSSTPFERPFQHKAEPYLLRIESAGDVIRVWQDKKLAVEASGKAIYGDSLTFPYSDEGPLDLGMVLVAAGGVTDAEWEALRRWAGQRWDVPSLPAGGSAGARAGSNWLMWAALFGLGGWAAYELATSEGVEPAQDSK